MFGVLGVSGLGVWWFRCLVAGLVEPTIFARAEPKWLKHNIARAEPKSLNLKLLESSLAKSLN